MRKSSRGNPYHVPKGSPKGGQFTSKGVGIPTYHSDDYYEYRTNMRFGRDVFGFDVTEINGNKHSNLRGEPAPSYIRCGGYDREKVRPYVINGKSYEGLLARKPIGGVWMSRSDAEYGWTDWCRDNYEDDWAKDPVELKVNGARILHIYDEKDLKKLPRTSECLTDIDYAKLARFYDGFELHISGIGNIMYGWDCDSTVIFNPDVIEKS